MLTCEFDVGACDSGAGIGATTVNYKNTTTISSFGGCLVNTVPTDFCCVVSDPAGSIKAVNVLGIAVADDTLNFHHWDWMGRTWDLRPTGVELSAAAHGASGDDKITGSNWTTNYDETLYGGDGIDTIFGQARQATT